MTRPKSSPRPIPLIKRSGDPPKKKTSDPTLVSPHWSEADLDIHVIVPAPGELFGDRYRVIGRIGAGGMGLVIHARDERLDRDVAIKLILPRLAQLDEIRRRFTTEARIMARVHHENVVSVFDFGELHNHPYLVMEYVPGTNLGSLRRKDGVPALTVDEVMRLFRQLSDGLAAIHAVGAVHRDLKPANVLIGSGFRLVITDFGLASLLDQPQVAGGVIVGTPAYMAPEVTHGAEATPQSDVYSLATLAFEFLVGQRPFRATDVMSWVQAHQTVQPPHPADLMPSLPREVGDVVLKGLSKEPLERQPGAQAFYEELARAVAKKAHAGPLRLLVADDDDDMRAFVATALLSAYPGAVVKSVPDGKAALEELERSPVSLAVLDLQMPGLDGMELTRAIRSSKKTGNPAIVVITAVGGAPDWRVLQALGANAFVVKPFDAATLQAAVNRLMPDPL